MIVRGGELLDGGGNGWVLQGFLISWCFSLYFFAFSLEEGGDGEGREQLRRSEDGRMISVFSCSLRVKFPSNFYEIPPLQTSATFAAFFKQRIFCEVFLDIVQCSCLLQIKKITSECQLLLC